MKTVVTCLVNNSVLKGLTRSSYTKSNLANIQQLLAAHEVLDFTAIQRGSFPAAATADSDNTGYQFVWVRDNVYVAYAHYVMGEYKTAARTLTGLMTYFQKFSCRFADVIENPALKEQVMQRPNVRFDGEHLTEVDEDWEHAQNDALGYFMWLYCKLAAQFETSKLIALDAEAYEMLLKFLLYFDAIRYWEDADSGHWEEG